MIFPSPQYEEVDDLAEGDDGAALREPDHAANVGQQPDQGGVLVALDEVGANVLSRVDQDDMNDPKASCSGTDQVSAVKKK